jgi:alkylresorcinol/alkylpyrone synthase
MTTSSTIVAVHGARPPHTYTQQEITAALAAVCGPTGQTKALLERFHTASRVEERHLALPLESYADLDGFGPANDVFIDAALRLGAEAVTGALDQAGLRPTDVDLVISTSVTGIAAPSLDARLVNRIGLRPDVKRVPIFGLGCVAGAAGVSRLHDYLRAWPDQVAVLLSVELCSLTLQHDDLSMPALVASGLFGDGAAAVVAVGERRAATLRRSGPAVVATRSRFYPDTEDVMGWDISSSGFRIVLSPDVPEVVERHLRADVDAFLAGHQLKTGDIETWICHPGGPKVLDAMAGALELDPGALDLTWRSLAREGNLSSASVLHVLRDTIAERPGSTGAPGLLLAMGPGFCAELVLLRW